MAENGRTKGEASLVLALAAGATVRDAARRANVAERTVYRRLEEPDFRQRIQTARSEMIAQAVGRLADAGVKAVETMVNLLGGESETVRLGAARAILEIGTKLREATDIEERLAALEVLAEARGGIDFSAPASGVNRMGVVR